MSLVGFFSKGKDLFKFIYTDEMFATKVLVVLRIDSYESAGLNTQIIHMLLTKNGSSILHQPPSSFRIRRIIHIG